jgi:hypothetical protein
MIKTSFKINTNLTLNIYKKGKAVKYVGLEHYRFSKEIMFLPSTIKKLVKVLASKANNE